MSKLPNDTIDQLVKNWKRGDPTLIDTLLEHTQFMRKMYLGDAQWLVERYHNGLMACGLDRKTAGHMAAEMVNKILEA